MTLWKYTYPHTKAFTVFEIHLLALFVVDSHMVVKSL